MQRVEASTKASPEQKVDVGILTIREDEFRAVLSAFPDEVGIHNGRREYALRSADAGEGRRYVVAVLRQIEQGNGEAQNAARDLIDDLEPSLLLVVGIAGGLPSDDFTLGDVVISTRVNDYNVEQRKARAEPTYSLSGGPIAKELAARVANLPAREKELGNWGADLPAKPRVNWKGKGTLYGPVKWKADLQERLQTHFGKGVEQREPLFVSGAIASSDTLVKDPKVLFPWIQSARHLLAVEMESGGVYRAATDRCPMLAIRGISDLVGLKRGDAWTKYACASAAAFTRAFLRTGPIKANGSTRPPDTATPRHPGTAPAPLGQAVASTSLDVMYTNLVPLQSYPDVVYISPTTCSYDQVWARLLEGKPGHVSRAWALRDGNLYSFEDPSTSRLARIADLSAVEAHSTADLDRSNDLERRKIFVQLLNGALREDLGRLGVWFIANEGIFTFAGNLDEPPRTYKFQNVKLRSTITVVSHYESQSKDGKVYPYLRHLAAEVRFRMLDDQWFAQITPTYRFTTDGKKKHWFHEERLSGIKRLEGNRAVLSQVLLWADLMAAAELENRLLKFGPAPAFSIERALADEELTALAGLGVDEIAGADETAETGGEVTK